MPSPDKEAPRDRELVRHSITFSEPKVPMWDSSDPERAPPPLPLNPRSMSPMSPATRSNVSPNIQAVAAKFTERPSEHAPSSYTTNSMPLKSSSPERSLVKGQHHKRMQSLQPEDTRQDARSDFLNYLENRSPERPLRATIIEAAKPRDPTKSISSPVLRQDADREMNYSVSSRYLSKPILGESTPPSATMLALQNMQLPLEPDPPSPSKPPKLAAAPFEQQHVPASKASMDSLSYQIHSLTDIASGLQREMMNLSRRSKDNATDLVSLKAATNARDEDIRKSLKDLSSHLTTKYLDPLASSPASKRSYSVPRMPSPNPFAFDRDSCISPDPISDGSAALALLEKVLREMATKEGEQRLLDLVEEIRSRPAPTGSDKDADNKVTVMLEEILNLVKEDPSSKALVRSYSMAANLDDIESRNTSPEPTQFGSTRSVDHENVRALDLSNCDKGDGSSPHAGEVLEILRSVKNSVVEGGGMTNGVKSLVRELRGEVLGMGRELGRRLDEIESSRASDEPEKEPKAVGTEEISAIVNRSLDDLKEQLAATINESRQQSSDLSEFRSTMNSAAIYSVVKKALDELELPQPQAKSQVAEMDREDILETVREAWETYKPEIEFNNFGLERDEILTCLEEGLKSYQPQHEQAVTYEQVLAAVEDGMQKFIPPQIEHPPSISRDEIILTIRECLEKQPDPASRPLDEEQVGHLRSMRDEILDAISKAMASHNEGSRSLDEEHVNHLYEIRDEILDAVTGTMAANNMHPKSLDEDHVKHLYSVRDEIIEAVTGAMASHSSSRPLDEDCVGQLNSIRDEILGALAGSMAQSTLSKESYDSGLGRDEIVSAVSDGLEAHFTTVKEMNEPRISRDDVMDAVKEAFDVQQSALALAQTNVSRDEILNAIAEGIRSSMNAQQSALSTKVQQNVSREEIFSAIVDAIQHSRSSLHNKGEPSISRDEILNAIADGIENSNKSSSRALIPSEQVGRDHQSTLSREEIFNAIFEAIEHSHASLGTNGRLSVSKEDILSAIAEGIEASTSSQQSALSTNIQEPSISREEILTAIAEGIQNGNSITREIELNQDDLMEAITSSLNEAIITTNANVGGDMAERLQNLIEGMKEELSQHSAAGGRDTEQVLDALKDGLEILRKEIETNVVAAADLSGKDEVIHTVKEGFRLLQADMERTITETSLLNAPRGIPDTPELLDAMEKEFEHLRGTITTLLLRNNATEGKDEILDAIREIADRHKNDTGDEVVNAIKQEFESLRERMEMSIVRAEPVVEKDEIILALRQHFDNLREETSAKDSKENDVLNTIKQEFENIRERMEMSVVRAEPGAEKDEIILALRQHFDNLREETSAKDSKENDVLNTIKQEFENIRERTEMSLVRAEPGTEKGEIISALREHFDILREETSRSDGSERTLSATSELLDAFTHGVDSIREDLKILLEKPTQFDSSKILDTMKDGLADLKREMDSLRGSSKELDDVSTAPGGVLMLANEPFNGPDIDGLKLLITKLHDKIEAIENAPRVVETAEDALKRSHLDEILLALHEVQLAMGEMSTQQSAGNDNSARKQDTEILEQLLLSTKTQIDELVFPSPDQVATPEHISALETIIREAKDSIAEFSRRFEAEAPTKSEIGTLEGLIKDVWAILDEMKGKTKDVEEEEDPERLLKSDLQMVEAMIFEVKTQVDELKLPDVDTLPTKTDIQELSTLVCDFREQMETNNELTAQGFDARKVEHGGLAEKIDDAKFVVGELGDELKSKLDGSTEGLTELKQLLEALTITAERFSTVNNIKELTDLINREFERSRGEEDAVKVEQEERDAVTLAKHDETRATIIIELGAKIDEKISEVLAKYEDASTSLHSKFSEIEERDLAHTESLASTRSLAEEIKLVIGAMGVSVNESCERLSVDTKALMEQVDHSRQQMENIHNDVKSHQEQSQAENERAAAATDRVESKLLEFHPRILESVQEILTIVSQHYDHSQKSAEDFKTELSALPSNLPAMLPALPPPEPDRMLAIEDTPLHSKIDDLLEHAKNNKVHEVLNTLLDHSKNDQLHKKLDRALDQQSGSNDQIYEKLSELLDLATNGSGPIHEKLDALLSRPLNPPESDHSVTQMTKLDEMHRDIMENSRRMNEMFAAQSVLVAEDTERKRREAEEAAVALERKVSQREQVEAELVGLHEEKDSMLNMIHRLRAEKEDLIKQNNKLSKDLSGLETALEIRHEEMRQMEDRADGLEKRILEGVLDHARTVLLGRSNSSHAMNLKRNRSTRSTRSSRTGARSPSVMSIASTAKEPKDSRSLLENGVGMALKRMPTSLQAGTVAVQPNIGKERRILSLSNVTGNRGVDRQVSAKSGITNLKRSHSVKSNSLRNTSWAGSISVADKENQPFDEEDELASDAEDASQQRKTSYAENHTPTDRKISYAESNIATETELNHAPSNAATDRRTSCAASHAGTERKTSYSGSIVDSVITDATDQRRVSGVSSTSSYRVAESSIAKRDHEDHHDEISIDGSESEDDAQTARENGENAGDEHQNEDHDMSRHIREANKAAEAEVRKLLAPSSDSGLGTDVAV
ncbi:chromosome segregation ATPase family protein [Penicillium digitatum]|uniref:Chromosome segregation ATPase family protein n=1 Tax=Penicillium digitatum TaxID=36651 RepID=A0A7T6XIB6_PENDI|nr:chromosome segregation ATPase family protein [Penicillium digitatum]